MLNKFGLLTALVLFVSACGGGGTSSGSSNVATTPTPSPTPDPYPAVAYDKVPALKSLADFPIGVEVSAGNQERSIFLLQDQQPVINRHFNSLVAGLIMKMKYLHPEENTYTFDDADELVDYAWANNMDMHGHTLIWYWDDDIPDFMKTYSGDWDTMMADHVHTIVDHFKGRVKSWDVVNEAIDVVNGVAQYRDSIFYQAMGPTYIENAYVTARAADPNALLYYNDFNISSLNAKSYFMLDMLDDFIARDIPIDGVGFQMHINLTSPTISQMKAAFKAVADRGLLVRISELDVQVNPLDTLNSLSSSTALQQKNRYKDVVQAYIEAVPPDLRGGITVWGLVDGETWLRAYRPHEWPLLFNDDYTVKPAFYGVEEALSDAQASSQ